MYRCVQSDWNTFNIPWISMHILNKKYQVKNAHILGNYHNIHINLIMLIMLGWQTFPLALLSVKSTQMWNGSCNYSACVKHN